MTFKKLVLSLCLLAIQTIAATGEKELSKFSEATFSRLARSSARADFFPLANHYEPQINKLACGWATGAMILDALRQKKIPDSLLPMDNGHYRGDSSTLPKNFNPLFNRYTQYTFFTPDTDKVKTLAQVNGEKINGVADYGIQLRQLAGMFSAHGLEVETFVVEDSATAITLSDYKSKIIANLAKEDDYVIINFLRKAMGQEGGGHISPLGAYDAETDSFLMIDVNPTHQRWTWIPWEHLVKGMQTKDTVENRGFLLVKDKSPPMADKAPPAANQ